MLTLSELKHCSDDPMGYNEQTIYVFHDQDDGSTAMIGPFMSRNGAFDFIERHMGDHEAVFVVNITAPKVSPEQWLRNQLH